MQNIFSKTEAVNLTLCSIEQLFIRDNHVRFDMSYSSQPPDIAGFPLGQGSQGKSDNMLEGQESGKLEIFWKKAGKSQGRKFLSTQSFNFNKKIIYT